jgi:hypothetical protein
MVRSSHATQIFPTANTRAANQSEHTSKSDFLFLPKMPCEQAAVNTRKISDLISLIQEYNRKAHSGANVCEDTMQLLWL